MCTLTHTRTHTLTFLSLKIIVLFRRTVLWCVPMNYAFIKFERDFVRIKQFATFRLFLVNYSTVDLDLLGAHDNSYIANAFHLRI